MGAFTGSGPHDGSIPARLGWPDRILAPLMFLASIGFLILLAGAIQHVRGDVVLPQGTTAYLWGILVLWPLFIVELAFYLVARNAFWWQHLLYALLPPLRMGATDHATGTLIWLPLLGWARRDRNTRQWLERRFSLPMIVVALLVLPVLVIEYYWSDAVQHNEYLMFAVDTTTSLIWLAFTFEFIVMISVTDNRLRYCARNWIDLVIILLPFVAFVRLIRVMQLAQLGQVSRLSRVYRLRGLVARMYRALGMLGIFRYFSNRAPHKRLLALKRELAEKESELEQIRREIAALETELAACNNAAPEPAPAIDSTPEVA